MAKKFTPTEIVQQGLSVIDAWNQINEQMAFGDLTFMALVQEVNAVGPILNRMTTLENELTDLRNQRDALCLAIAQKLTRVRRGVSAFYGLDSSQYEMVGGTRTSERKPPKRRTAATA
jgi:hypothetical protein